MVLIEDIAQHLSNICRIGGATHQFYSVAQHSILVSEPLPVELQFTGLERFKALRKDSNV